ncbi:MAG: DUF4440 domain-containing protein [Flavobacteriales bacterium]|nr:DUF4440 domain-containing protein [Flavobacteriales bacterium]
MRLHFLFPTLTLGGLLLFNSCGAPAKEAAPAVDMTALTATVQAMEDAYATAQVAKDADAVVNNYYADDVVSYMREREPMQGKAAVRERIAEQMSKDTTGITPTFKVLDLFVGTDHMTEIGSYTDTDKAGTVVDQGTYWSIFRKNGDAWQCIREIEREFHAEEGRCRYRCRSTALTIVPPRCEVRSYRAHFVVQRRAPLAWSGAAAPEVANDTTAKSPQLGIAGTVPYPHFRGATPPTPWTSASTPIPSPSWPPPSRPSSART